MSRELNIVYDLYDQTSPDVCSFRFQSSFIKRGMFGLVSDINVYRPVISTSLDGRREYMRIEVPEGVDSVNVLYGRSIDGGTNFDKSYVEGICLTSSFGYHFQIVNNTTRYVEVAITVPNQKTVFGKVCANSNTEFIADSQFISIGTDVISAPTTLDLSPDEIIDMDYVCGYTFGILPPQDYDDDDDDDDDDYDSQNVLAEQIEYKQPRKIKSFRTY